MRHALEDCECVSYYPTLLLATITEPQDLSNMLPAPLIQLAESKPPACNSGGQIFVPLGGRCDLPVNCHPLRQMFFSGSI